MPRLPRSFHAYFLYFLLLSTIAGLALAADTKEPKKDAPYSPFVQKSSKEGEDAIKRFQYDKSLKVELWAAEPMLANPVCFAFDGKGRCYVAETFRHSAGATDNRGKPWLDDDLASRTVEDRVEMFKKHAGKNFIRDYETEHDRVRLIEDTTGSGKADKATVFRDDFGKAEDGIGAGLLARNGDVYFSCIPGLFKMKDTKGTGQADVKETLSTGYGVHVAFIGHDLHGLRMGPDGKLYFSIGDRGFNVKTKEGKHLFYPDTGAVLRCDLDGANLEVVHIGFGNIQRRRDASGPRERVRNGTRGGHLVERRAVRIRHRRRHRRLGRCPEFQKLAPCVIVTGVVSLDVATEAMVRSFLHLTKRIEK